MMVFHLVIDHLNDFVFWCLLIATVIVAIIGSRKGYSSSSGVILAMMTVIHIVFGHLIPGLLRTIPFMELRWLWWFELLVWGIFLLLTIIREKKRFLFSLITNCAIFLAVNMAVEIVVVSS